MGIARVSTVVGALLGAVIGGATLWSLNGVLDGEKERRRVREEEREDERRREQLAAGGNVVAPPPVIPPPVAKIEPPPAPVALAADEQFLRDLKPAEVATQPYPTMKLDRTFTLAGVTFEHGLTLHAQWGGKGAHVTYSLDKPYSRLHGTAGVPDHTAKRSASPLTFVILADGAEVWRSKPLQTCGEWAEFEVDLTGAKELKLAVEAGLAIDGAHAAWLDPKLVASSTTPPLPVDPPAVAKADPPVKPEPPIPPAPVEVAPKSGDAPPKPVAPKDGERYLRDLEPTQIAALTRPSLEYDHAFKLADVTYEHGVFLHAQYFGRGAHALYTLDKPYSRLRGAAGVADNSIDGSKAPLTFVIFADGKELWRSEPMQKSGDWAPFDVDLTGAKELKLAVEAGRRIDGAHAVWLDPKLID